MARSRALLALFVLALAALGAMSGAVWTSAASGAPEIEPLYGDAAALEAFELGYEARLSAGITLVSEAGSPLEASWERGQGMSDQPYIFIREDSFAPAPDGSPDGSYATLDFNLVNGPDGRRLEMGDGPGWPMEEDPISGSSSCVVTPFGWAYMSYEGRTNIGDNERGELVDASGLPGGEWGVWRIPLEVTGETVDGVWRPAPGKAARCPDPARVENVLPLGNDWEDITISASADRSRVYVLLLEDGLTVRFYALDAASGELLADSVVYRLDESARMDVYAQPGEAFVLVLGERLLMTELSGNGLEVLFEAELAELEPFGVGPGAYFSPYAACCKDGRLAALCRVYDGEFNQWDIAAVFDEGGLVSAARVTTELSFAPEAPARDYLTLS